MAGAYSLVYALPCHSSAFSGGAFLIIICKGKEGKEDGEKQKPGIYQEIRMYLKKGEMDISHFVMVFICMFVHLVIFLLVIGSEDKYNFGYIKGLIMAIPLLS